MALMKVALEPNFVASLIASLIATLGGTRDEYKSS
jgi:hypothetical protein